jgi:single-strand DNA-binding protein
VYSVQIIAEEIEFAESKGAQAQNGFGGGASAAPTAPTPSAASGDGFIDIADGIEDELPF